MSNLRRGFERFCFRNRDKGIPNLMLYIALGNALVAIMSMVHGGLALYELLYFDKAKILQGQVWRLVTFVFTQSGSGLIDLLFLYFFYMLGRHVEISMGTFKFNLFYFSGVILMDIYAMIFSPAVAIEDVLMGGMATNADIIAITVYSRMAYYLHLTLVLTFATLYPDSQFMIFFIIPVRAWLIALIYLLLEAIAVINLSYPVMYFPHNLFPLVALANYLLFMGGDIKNLAPWARRMRARPKKSEKKTGVTRLPTSMDYPASPAKNENYTHRCTVCGRTDVSNPELEFRYCSRCNGYYCYCQEHINNHEHIE